MQEQRQDGAAGATEPPLTEMQTDNETATETASADDQSGRSLQEQLEEERAKAQTYYSQWQRERADFLNFKRRTEEQRANDARFHNLSLVLNILPVVDDLNLALANVDSAIADSKWTEGLRAIQRKFEGALTATGVEQIAADGQDFDPTRHEAIGQQPGPEGKVVAVIRNGYTMGDRTIRPALVMVGDGTEG